MLELSLTVRPLLPAAEGIEGFEFVVRSLEFVGVAGDEKGVKNTGKYG